MLNRLVNKYALIYLFQIFLFVLQLSAGLNWFINLFVQYFGLMGMGNHPITFIVFAWLSFIFSICMVLQACVLLLFVKRNIPIMIWVFSIVVSILYLIIDFFFTDLIAGYDTLLFIFSNIGVVWISLLKHQLTN